MNPKIKAAFAERHRLRETDNERCVLGLVGRRCRCYFREHRPPRWDHPCYWIKDGRLSVVTYEPYCYDRGVLGLIEEERNEIAFFSERWGLELTVDETGSWWAPGMTVLIALRAKVREGPPEIDRLTLDSFIWPKKAEDDGIWRLGLPDGRRLLVSSAELYDVKLFKRACALQLGQEPVVPRGNWRRWWNEVLDRVSDNKIRK